MYAGVWLYSRIRKQVNLKFNSNYFRIYLNLIVYKKSLDQALVLHVFKSCILYWNLPIGFRATEISRTKDKLKKFWEKRIWSFTLCLRMYLCTGGLYANSRITRKVVVIFTSNFQRLFLRHYPLRKFKILTTLNFLIYFIHNRVLIALQLF